MKSFQKIQYKVIQRSVFKLVVLKNVKFVFFFFLYRSLFYFKWRNAILLEILLSKCFQLKFKFFIENELSLY